MPGSEYMEDTATQVNRPLGNIHLHIRVWPGVTVLQTEGFAFLVLRELAEHSFLRCFKVSVKVGTPVPDPMKSHTIIPCRFQRTLYTTWWLRPKPLLCCRVRVVSFQRLRFLYITSSGQCVTFGLVAVQPVKTL